MPTSEVAHLCIFDVELAVVFFAPDFDERTPTDRQAIYATLQDRLETDGLTRTLALVWKDSAGITKFLAPPQQHAFLQILEYDQLHVHVDLELRWS